MSLDYPNLVATSGDVTTVADLAGRYLYCSAATEDVFGWEPNKLVGRYEDDLVHPDDAASLQHGRAEHASSRPVTTSYRFRCRNGSYRWVEATSRRVTAGSSEVVVTTVRDITERQRLTAALELRATTDPLTGVANRAVFMDRLQQALRRLSRGSKGVLVVMYLDLDRFKVVNDSLGHHAGDDVLLKTAERLTRHLRPADTLARLGGDEFALVAEGVVDEASAVILANRIIEDGRRPFRVGGEEISCTVSIGVTCTTDSKRNAHELLAEADCALYRAKRQGRDRVAVFDEGLRSTAIDRLVTERMVRRALNDGRIVVEYQPIVDTRSAAPVGAEALVRVRDPEQGLRLPGSFLRVAEETGLLMTIDEVVLADAVKQASFWRARLGATFDGVAVNVTARHVADSQFRQALLDQLAAHDVPAHQLQVELTEQVLMDASNSAMTGLRALRALGIRVGLDDFGSGFSSLACLRQFPLDFVKIDKSLIDDIAIDPSVRAIVAAIIGLSHALDLSAIAEGVERASQRHVLIDLGCDRAQGFLFGASSTPGKLDKLALAELVVKDDLTGVGTALMGPEDQGR